MFTDLDLIRRAQTGVELLATLRWLRDGNSTSNTGTALGEPYSLLSGPCTRCWLNKQTDHQYCPVCAGIAKYKNGLDRHIRNMIVVWGEMDQIPDVIVERNWAGKKGLSEVFIPNRNLFLVMIHRLELNPLLKEIALRYGDELNGLMQIFPTMGMTHMGMGDVLCRAMHYEKNFPMDMLRVRFYSHPLQLNRPHIRDRNGMLTFSMPEFLNLLELTRIFKTYFGPSQQNDLYQILTQCEDSMEQGFLWGRFYGQISEEAKDMLSSWDVKHWPRNTIELVYELMTYVAYSEPD